MHAFLDALTSFGNRLLIAQKFIYICITIFTVLGNTLVLVTTWRDKRLHQPNKYFIASLAIADLLIGLILAPMWLYQIFLDDVAKRAMSIHLCRFTIWLDTLVSTASIYTLTFISFDCYLKISAPLKYKSRMTTSKSVKIIIFIWVISAAYATYSATPHSGSQGIMQTGQYCPYVKNRWKVVFTISTVITFIAPSVMMLVMYASIFIVAHKRRKMAQNGELGQASNNLTHRSVFIQDLKVIRMLLVVIGVFILCWGPFNIAGLIFLYSPNIVDLKKLYMSLTNLELFLVFVFVTGVLPHFNSLCNPVIYAWLDQTYKEAFKNQFDQMFRRTNLVRRQTPETIALRHSRVT